LSDCETHDKVGHAVHDMVQAQSKGSNDTLQLLSAEYNNILQAQTTDVVQFALLDFATSTLINPKGAIVPETNSLTQYSSNIIDHANLNFKMNKNLTSSLGTVKILHWI
jgi:hypothetical protein